MIKALSWCFMIGGGLITVIGFYSLPSIMDAEKITIAMTVTMMGMMLVIIGFIGMRS